ncbi:Zn(II)2Cys6 transcription factor domain-containing protein [Aspergillus stella-maris]|uniref:Zn(II)2Cys6 transcription factor domain-containing protein n=1 Tax=Aspergillus stella-maris TaxID=1810926 RepID=UPI003CCCA04B
MIPATLAHRRSSRDAGRVVYGVGSGGENVSDERKPRCQNCIDKNFDCNYGLQVTFLAKNSITVTANEIHSPKVERALSGSNRKFQFVNEDPLSINNLVDSFPDEPQPLSTTSSGSGTALPTSPAPIPPKEENDLRYSISDPVSSRERDDGYVARNTLVENRGPEDILPEPYSRATFAPWEPAHRSYNEEHTNNSTQETSAITVSQSIRPASFSAKDEFAVRGLLALGTQPGLGPGVDYVSSPVQNADQPGAGIEQGTPFAPDTPNRIPSFLDGLLGVSTPTAQLPFDLDAGNGNLHNSVSDPKSETWKMRLLQHYRYNVAPWLDIHDLSHAFGIAALQTAVESSSGRLLPSLLALSEACLRTRREHGYAHKNDNEYQTVRFEDKAPYSGHQHSESFSSGLESSIGQSLTEVLLLRCFEELKGLVSDVAGTWAGKSNAFHVYEMLRPLIDQVLGLGMESALYWMFLRMDIGQALANNAPIRIPLPSYPIPSIALLCQTENTPQRVGHCAQVLLWLCTKALNEYHRDSKSGSHHLQEIGTNSWLDIFKELNQWHYLRPQEFQPMVEVSNDGSEDLSLNAGSEFPLLLFTNGAGALCNQLYHTAMLFMLDCKPRTTPLLNLNHSHHSPSAALSPLWHAQRICGIALNNDRRECWDPCLLASFLVAAKHMTHESQQVEIIRGFDRIEALTGWSVGEYLTQLREEWSFLDGV